MNRSAATTRRKIATALSCIVVILLVTSSHTCRDDIQLRQSNPRGVPLHLLPDERLVEAYRSIGYVTSLTCQQPFDSLFCSMLNGDETPTLRYLGGEVMRYQRLCGEAFHTSSAFDLYARVLQSADSRKTYYRLAQRQRYLYDRLYEKGKLSHDIADSIEADIADFKRLGLDSWSGYDYDIYAFYNHSIDEDEKAYESLQKALACDVANGNIALASKVAGEIGRHLLRTGDWLRSEDAFLASLRYANEAGDKDFISRALSWLARFRASQGYSAEAESLLIRALERGGGTVDPSTEVTELLALAELYIDQREFSRAGAIVDRAILRAQADLSDPAIAANRNHRYFLMVYLATAMSYQASIQNAKGEIDAASASMRSALRIGGETADAGLKAELLGRLGDIESTAGRPADAVRSYSDALSIVKRMHDRASEAKYARAVGQAYVDLGRFEEADAWFADALARNPGGRSWMQQVDILHSMARAKSGEGNYAAAKTFCERGIAALDAGLAKTRFEAPMETSRERLDSMCDDLLVLESDHFYECDSLVYIAELSRQLRTAAENVPHADLRQEVHRCLERREWIPDRALVIQHLVTPEKTIVIAIDRYGETYRSIPVPAERLREEIAAFIEACGTLRGGGDAAGEARFAAAEDRARSLYRLLLEPIQPLIEGKDVLCFIPDDALLALPFGALIPPGAPTRFLIEGKRILFSPALLVLESRSTAGPAPLPGERYRSELLIGQSEISPFIGRLYPSLDSLPQARGEVAEIRRLIPGATVLLGRSATKDSVVALLGGADLIHIATHTVQFPAYGGQPALLLSPPAQRSLAENVGASLLTATDIAAMNFSGTKLAVVSSCESAIGTEAERVQGLGVGGAFYEAGARSVIATVWPIEDAAAEQFASVFYEELLRRPTVPADALRHAINRIIGEDRSRGSALRRIDAWGPFILLGSF